MCACSSGLQIFSGQLQARGTGGEAHPAAGSRGRKRRYTPRFRVSGVGQEILGSPVDADIPSSCSHVQYNCCIIGIISFFPTMVLPGGKKVFQHVLNCLVSFMSRLSLYFSGDY